MTKDLISKCILIFLVLTGTVLAQELNFRNLYLSGGVGEFFSTHAKFSEVYKSRWGLDYFGEFGYAMSNKTYLTAKVSYFQKNGTPVIFTFNNNGLQSQSTAGTAKFIQWIYNFGILYDFFLSKDFSFNINGGIFYSTINDLQKESDGITLINLDSKSVGAFIGGGVEKNLPVIPVSLIFTAQFNYASQVGLIGTATDYGGLNFTLGARIYIGDRLFDGQLF
jgi:hypothetical protein